ncbi:MAG: TetR/AcrR family transcriptional regulator [Erysipelotrichia bacterium]|nr:TetR/AcrR family transcriptional regulator [Erysipelotrichia bacterium]
MRLEDESEKKSEIRKKALALFQKNGYDAVTINEICNASGISKNTFYYHFASKEELIMDLFRVMLSMSEEELIKIMAISDPLEQLRYVWRTLTNDAETLGKEVMKKAMMANLSRAESLEADCKDRKHKPNPYMDMLRSMYERAQALGEVRSDVTPKSLMKSSMAMFIGCLQIWATAPVELGLTEMYAENYELLILDQKQKNT